MNPAKWVKGKLIARELRAMKEKLMGHKAKTWIEGLLIAVGLGLLDYSGKNIALLLGSDIDRKTFFGGLTAAALMVARLYVAARYSTPPDVQEKIAEGSFPERRETPREEEK